MSIQDKPSWKDAPEWAQWMAMDEDGEWFWYENEPTPSTEASAEWTQEFGRCERALIINWASTLEARPHVSTK